MTTQTTDRPATEAQMKYIDRLLAERNIPAPWQEMIDTCRYSASSTAAFTTKVASATIDELLKYKPLQKATQPTTVPVAPVEQTDLPNATYTVIMGDGSHLTLTLAAAKEKFAPNKQIASYLFGPNNDGDYKGFAFVNGRSAKIWRAFQPNTRLAEGLSILLNGTDPMEAGKRYALESGRCCVCNRTLTVPASIEAGIGPECAKRF